MGGARNHPRAAHRTAPGFLFVAEAYRGREFALQQQGLDRCYVNWDRTGHDVNHERYVELPTWGWHLFHVDEPTPAGEEAS
ncbi:hypothetical protein MRQ36_28665 [Micromonospora sp. R77]|uniref:hypothetical protein n=1 Tax=Micromonospora sp. R77 TaxID=2925836 RepID=UPI001F62229C|nr:hypothetical protein [Micromonospora sp. R77]MCI4066310.1 hypothetical protein [Micromonospora sp. R77]